MPMPNQSRFLPRYISLIVVAVITLLALPACQPSAATSTPGLPTLAVLPSLAPTEAASATPTSTEIPAETVEPTATTTVTLPPSNTPLPTSTPLPTGTPFMTLTPTVTQTPTALHQAVFSTLTPLPPGTLPPPGTPQQLANVIITRQEFQNEVNLEIGNYPTMQQAIVEFTSDGTIKVQLTALGGQAYITGQVTLSVQVSNGLAAITTTDISVNAPEPPQTYVDVVNNDFFTMIVNVLNTILADRVGPQQKLKDMVVSGDQILISLLVPK